MVMEGFEGRDREARAAKLLMLREVSRLSQLGNHIHSLAAAKKKKRGECASRRRRYADASVLMPPKLESGRKREKLVSASVPRDADS